MFLRLARFCVEILGVIFVISGVSMMKVFGDTGLAMVVNMNKNKDYMKSEIKLIS